MADLDADMVATLAAAEEARTQFEAALMAFNISCFAHNWDAAETARAEAFAHMEAYLDRIAAAHMRLEAADADGKQLLRRAHGRHK